MADGWGAALQAGVNGYFRGAQMTEDAQDRKDEKAWRDEQRAEVRRQQQEQQAQRQALKDAAQPVALVEGAGDYVKPPTMDNRDAGEADNFKPMAAVVGGQLKQDGMAAPADGGLQRGGFSVAGKSFTDRAAADAELARQNSPEAVNQRTIAALRGTGQIEKALALEQSVRASEVQNMQLADQRWKRDLGKAMRGGHAGLAQLATGSDAGAMAGMKVSVVPSADGKTVTYAALDKDGNANPIPGLPAFSNDQNGLVQAAWMLDQTITPEARMAHYTTEKNREDDRSDKKENRDETKRHNMAMEGLASGKLGSRGASRKASGADGAAPFDPLSDFDPKQARKGAMDQAIEEAKGAGVGKDGKPAATEQQIAMRAQAIYGAMRDAAAADNAKRYVTSAAMKALQQAKGDPGAYAATYEKARAKGLSNADLAAAGFGPPGSTGGTQPVTQGAAAVPPLASASQPAVQRPNVPRPSTPTALSAQRRQEKLADPATAAAIAAAGARLDQARAQLAAAQAERRPGLAKGAAEINEFSTRLQSAREAVAQAEADYQRALPSEVTSSSFASKTK
jgi:hypothetical protein